jgi:hypothetical protein
MLSAKVDILTSGDRNHHNEHGACNSDGLGDNPRHLKSRTCSRVKTESRYMKSSITCSRFQNEGGYPLIVFRKDIICYDVTESTSLLQGRGRLCVAKHLLHQQSTRDALTVSVGGVGLLEDHSANLATFRKTASTSALTDWASS